MRRSSSAMQLLQKLQVSVTACSHEAASSGAVRVRVKTPMPGCPDAELVWAPSQDAGSCPEAAVPLPDQIPAYLILEVCHLWQRLALLNHAHDMR